MGSYEDLATQMPIAQLEVVYQVQQQGLQPVCEAAATKLGIEQPDKLRDLVSFANIVYPKKTDEETRQRFLDSKMLEFAVLQTAGRFASIDLSH